MTAPVAYSAVVATFRRPEALRGVLTSVLAQTVPPLLVIVADNDPLRSAENVTLEIAGSTESVVLYLPTGENVGPAGAWARAASSARAHRLRGDFLLVVDDDDPLGHHDLVRRLSEAASEVPGPACGAVGLRGAVIRRSGRLVRREGPEGVAVAVDYLASGGAPLYRWEAIDDVGFFDEGLFFGFEDLDQGLRLGRAGWTLWAIGLPSLHRVADSSDVRTPWREYYKVRAQAMIARRHLGMAALLMLTVRTLMLGSMRLIVLQRGTALARARLLGWFDGLRGHLGPRRYDPSVNPAKIRSAP